MRDTYCVATEVCVPTERLICIAIARFAIKFILESASRPDKILDVWKSRLPEISHRMPVWYLDL